MMLDVFHVDISKAHDIFEVHCNKMLMVPRNMLYTYGIDFTHMIFLPFCINWCGEAPP